MKHIQKILTNGRAQRNTHETHIQKTQSEDVLERESVTKHTYTRKTYSETFHEREDPSTNGTRKHMYKSHSRNFSAFDPIHEST
jgi:hypothetical protein